MMVAHTPRDAVVVGVDSSQDSDRAVMWALGLASHTHQPVHFVHAQLPPAETVTDEIPRRRWAEAGRAVLDAAMAQAKQVTGVPTSGQSLEETGPSTAQALVQASHDAAMLVLGARGHGGYTGLLMGSVSQHAARHAVCPVVTVRRQADPDERRLVVGVDQSEGAQDALALAFQLASDLRADLTVIHAFHAPALHGVGVTLPLPADTGEAIGREEDQLADQVRPWQLKFPHVRVVREVIPGHATSVLTDASAHAALVVVGSRGRGAFTGMLLGSVSQGVLHHARCPVAVAP